MKPDIPLLTTPRLILRPLELADAEVIQSIFPQWEIVKYMPVHVPWPYPFDGALTYVRDRCLPAMEQGKERHWSIRLKSSPDRLIGCIGLTEKTDDHRCFWLDPAWQRQGLMTEACDEVTRYWFETLGRPFLRVCKAKANTACRRISERAGMRLLRAEEKECHAGRFPIETWEITAEEWRQRQIP